MAKRKRPQRRKAGHQRIHKKVAKAWEEQDEAFRRKFGRDPVRGDPVFFDPDADEPEQIDPDKFTALMVIPMIRADIPQRLIYAFIRLGMMLTEDNRHVFSEEDLAEWDQAMWEYDKHFGDDDS